MTDLAAILRYMAEVASADAPPQTHVGPLVRLSEATATGSIIIRAADESGAAGLVAADLLHKEEHLIWQGYLWIEGTHDGRKYLFPMIRRRVATRSTMRKAADAVLGVPLTLEPQTEWTVNPGLLGAAELETLAGRPVEWGIGGSSGGGRIERAHPGLAEFVATYLEAAGLPDDAKLRQRWPKDPGDGVHVVVATGLYLDREPYKADRASALRLWATRVPVNTALASLYGSGSRWSRQSQDVVVRSPLPLNGEQRRAVELSVNEDVVVVSGPPGTGKSHLVAAAAISEIAAGGSVLIASKSVHACDVVDTMLRRFPMIEPIRFGDEQTARKLGDQLAAGVPSTDERFDAGRLTKRVERIESEITDQVERIGRRLTAVDEFDHSLRRREDMPLWLATQDLEELDIRRVRDAADDLAGNGLFGRWRARRAARLVRAVLGVQAPRDAARVREICDAVDAARAVDAIAGRDLRLRELWDELEALQEQWRYLIGELLEADRRDRAGRRARASLGELSTALRTGPMARRRALAEMGDRFLDVAPLWLGTLGEIETIAPIRPGLFDLVILDEASQISQLSAAPALARGKRAIIVGDSRQLRHVSFVSERVQHHAAEVAGLPDAVRQRLDDRHNSVFDAATAIAPVVDLVEHFRSSPHIIGFSNREFYGGRLQLMTQHPGREFLDAIRVEHVTGERDGSGVVRSEVERVLELVRDFIAAGLEVGVVSPFRAQAEAIESQLQKSLTLEQLHTHRVRAGTVHSFQGTEREVMIISLGFGPADRQARRFVEDPAIFNVMVTRARTQVVIVTALAGDEVGSGLLARYLRHADEPPARRPEVAGGTGWTARLAAELAAGGDERVITDYEVAGDTIDIVVGDGEDAIGIETELHPGGVEQHISRHMALRRAGWDIREVFRSAALGREEEVIAGLLARSRRRNT